MAETNLTQEYFPQAVTNRIIAQARKERARKLPEYLNWMGHSVAIYLKLTPTDFSEFAELRGVAGYVLNRQEAIACGARESIEIMDECFAFLTKKEPCMILPAEFYQTKGIKVPQDFYNRPENDLREFSEFKLNGGRK